jgi:predicted nucleotidyltransferase
MGTQPAAISLSGALFSRVQARVLGILFGQADREFQLSEIIALAGSGRGAVQRELQKLTAAGIVDLATRGTRKLYRANRSSPIFSELRQLVTKTVGIADPIREALAVHRDAIDAAFVYGSVAKGKDTATSDIDVMIIGDKLGYGDVYGALQKAEAVLSRQVNPTLMTRRDWLKKAKDRNAFVTRVLAQPKLFVVGTQDELGPTR